MLAGWDATALKNYDLENNTNIAAVVGEMSMALGALNAEFTSSPLWSQLISVTDVPELEYRQGSSNGFGEFTEYGLADPKRADTTGHMLPLIAYDRRLEWTWDYLRQSRPSQIEADIADAIKDGRDKWRVQVLTRCLKRGDDSGAKLGLGTAGESPGFATAAASTGVDFTPPAWGGNSFDSDHEHYVGIAGGLFTAAVFSDAKAELREHGHEPPYNFIIGGSDESTVRGLTGFTEVPELLVRYGGLQDLAMLPVQELSDGTGAYAIGTIDDFAVWVVPGVPQYYGFGWKPYGSLSQRNPLKIRVRKGQSNPMVVAMTDPRNGNATHPLQNLMLFFEFGVGVADRTNGTARYTNNATWADGTPT
jgi:hypothetical protein